MFTKKQPLRTTWEQWTGLTEYTDHYPITKQRKKLFLTFLSKLPKGQNVLDVGCHVGDMVLRIHQLGFHAYGIDVMSKNIQQAKVSYPHLSFTQAELNEKIPFPDNFFDVIWAGDIIEHVYDTITLFSEFNRVLKKGGYLVCSTPYHGILKMIAIALVDLDRHFHPEHPHVRFYTATNFRKILRKYGFSVKEEHYLGRIRLLSNNMLFISRKVRELDWERVPHTFR
jgi:2-polyprenyl-6-hydroxyphenyl methylase/3-demethylubiquinone-9 3-methyltransferase